MHPANERWCYIVTSSLIGWPHSQNDPCVPRSIWVNCCNHKILYAICIPFPIVHHLQWSLCHVTLLHCDLDRSWLLHTTAPRNNSYNANVGNFLQISRKSLLQILIQAWYQCLLYKEQKHWIKCDNLGCWNYNIGQVMKVRLSCFLV